MGRQINPPGEDEMTIEGHWIFERGKMLADDAALRIDDLTSCYFEFVSSVDGGWSMLYRDPRDGRFWEQSYPHGERHGGGPPRLEVIPSEVARERYSITT